VDFIDYIKRDMLTSQDVKRMQRTGALPLNGEAHFGTINPSFLKGKLIDLLNEFDTVPTASIARAVKVVAGSGMDKGYLISWRIKNIQAKN